MVPRQIQYGSTTYWYSTGQPLGSAGASRKILLYDSLPLRAVPDTQGLVSISTNSPGLGAPDRSISQAVDRLRAYPYIRDSTVREILKFVYGYTYTKQLFKQTFLNRKEGTASADGASIQERDRIPGTQVVLRRGGKRKRGGDGKTAPSSTRIENKTYVDMTYTRTIPAIRHPDSFIRSEILLYHVDIFVLKLFRSESWGYDSLNLIPPRDTQSFEKEWKGISDKCWSVAGLFNKGAIEEAEGKLQSIILELEGAIQFEEPHLLVRIWRICRYLHGIRAYQGRSAPLQRLLGQLETLSRNQHGQTSPTCQIFQALSAMTSDDVLWALRIGQLRAIHNLQEIIGRDHPTVLCMWSYYAKQWRVCDDLGVHLMNVYMEAWEKAQSAFGSTSMKAVSILHDSLYYALYRHPDQASLIERLATNLFKHTSDGLFGSGKKGPLTLQWGPHAQFLAFAGKTLARLNRVPESRRDASIAWLEQTAFFLGLGDSECKTRASMLQDESTYWAGKWGLVSTMAREREGKPRETISDGLQAARPAV